ncbi:hypothetical protein JZK55_12180 [Dissulfurispira thermophila]|uniref:Uncharacterized protein n=1 Tax=Dissulfurispira thermophila TaxID=2715679 RepID=A0A7G1H2X8_9BACT|nr:hypothetical protein JZK55_12180 [Dissulfurispira thermophila]
MEISQLIIIALISLNLLIPLIFCIKLNNNFSKDGVKIDHILLFSAAFIFYWIFPILFGLIRLFEYEPSMNEYYQIFDQINDYVLIKYLLISLFCYMSFVIGSFF